MNIEYNWVTNPKRRIIMENSKHYVYERGSEKLEAGTIVDRLIKRYTCDHPNMGYEQAFKAISVLPGNEELFKVYTRDSSTLM